MAASDPDFRVIYAEFQPRILRYVARMLGADEAEDLTQEVFTRVARALPTFRGDAKLSTWIYRIATNAALDRLRALSQDEAIALPDSTEDLDAGNLWTGQAEASPEAQLYRTEMHDCIRDFVGRLPPNDRAVLVLGEFEGLKDDEVASVLGITRESAKMRLHRARRRLKRSLVRGCGPEWIEANEFLPELKRRHDPPRTAR